MHRLILAIVTAAAPTFSHAACSDFQIAIENSQKEIAMQGERPYGDTAQREANRLTRISNELAAIKINLILMEREKCPLPADPIDTDGNPFTGSAVSCHIAKGRAGFTNGNECDKKLWTRNRKLPADVKN